MLPPHPLRLHLCSLTGLVVPGSSRPCRKKNFLDETSGRPETLAMGPSPFSEERGPQMRHMAFLGLAPWAVTWCCHCGLGRPGAHDPGFLSAELHLNLSPRVSEGHQCKCPVWPLGLLPGGTCTSSPFLFLLQRRLVLQERGAGDPGQRKGGSTLSAPKSWGRVTAPDGDEAQRPLARPGPCPPPRLPSLGSVPTSFVSSVMLLTYRVMGTPGTHCTACTRVHT